jgi:hypothetical protein
MLAVRLTVVKMAWALRGEELPPITSRTRTRLAKGSRSRLVSNSA